MRFALYTISFLFCISCTKVDPYNPEAHLSPKEQIDILKKTIRYSAKPAPNANHETKFDTAFNWYYDKAIAEYDIRKYFITEDETHYFLFTRVARSVTPMREAIGGKLMLDVNSNVKEYEEVFRTWKMSEDSLNTRAFELFEKMVTGEDLTPYRAKYKGDRYIEYPDDRFYFSKEDKRWHDKVFDSLKMNP